MKDINEHRQRIVSSLNSLDARQKRAAQHLQRSSKGSRRRLHSAIIGHIKRQGST